MRLFTVSAPMKSLALAAMMAAILAAAASPAPAFEIGFDWRGLALCTSGRPNIVQNPRFELKGVPAATRFIDFRLVDLDAPAYNHGGGRVAWSGQKVIEPGAFTYKSPCPPVGRHTYQWTATARTRTDGATIGEAKARRQYP